jgi:hypothetical protein
VGKCLHKTSSNLLLQLIEVRFNMSHEFDPWATDSFDGREHRSSEREQKREEDGKNTNKWDTMSDCESWSWMWPVPHLVCGSAQAHQCGSRLRHGADELQRRSRRGCSRLMAAYPLAPNMYLVCHASQTCRTSSWT